MRSRKPHPYPTHPFPSLLCEESTSLLALDEQWGAGHPTPYPTHPFPSSLCEEFCMSDNMCISCPPAAVPAYWNPRGSARSCMSSRCLYFVLQMYVQQPGFSPSGSVEGSPHHQAHIGPPGPGQYPTSSGQPPVGPSMSMPGSMPPQGPQGPMGGSVPPPNSQPGPPPPGQPGYGGVQSGFQPPPPGGYQPPPPMGYQPHGTPGPQIAPPPQPQGHVQQHQQNYNAYNMQSKVPLNLVYFYQINSFHVLCIWTLLSAFNEIISLLKETLAWKLYQTVICHSPCKLRIVKYRRTCFGQAPYMTDGAQGKFDCISHWNQYNMKLFWSSETNSCDGRM